MEMRQEKSVYSFMSREGDEDAALRINEGKYKGTIYSYSNIILPKEDDGNLRLSFRFDILDYAGKAKEEGVVENGDGFWKLKDVTNIFDLVV